VGSSSSAADEAANLLSNMNSNDHGLSAWSACAMSVCR